APHVKVFDGMTGELLQSLFPYRSSFTGGVFVAVGDLDGDGPAELVPRADPGGPAGVRGDHAGAARLLPPMTGLRAFGSSFAGGVRVAVGDVNGDGTGEIIVAPGAGGAPLVKVFSASSAPGGAGGFSELQSFVAYRTSFTGGVYVAAGDLDGDSKQDIV